jgi:DNA-binding CsgD family transcriptional regulator
MTQTGGAEVFGSARPRKRSRSLTRRPSVTPSEPSSTTGAVHDRDGRPRDDAHAPARRVRAAAAERRGRGGAARRRTGASTRRHPCSDLNAPKGVEPQIRLSSNRQSRARLLASRQMQEALTKVSTRITERQRQVIELIAAGCSNEEVGERLGISPRTAKAHCDVLRQKLGVARRRQIPVAYRLLTGDDPLSRSLGPASDSGD